MTFIHVDSTCDASHFRSAPGGSDKLLLVLTESSIKSAWVEKEVETAFEKERKQGKIVLFPIQLDGAVIDAEEAWAAESRLTP